jgi:O-antigen ligase
LNEKKITASSFLFVSVLAFFSGTISFFVVNIYGDILSVILALPIIIVVLFNFSSVLRLPVFIALLVLFAVYFLSTVTNGFDFAAIKNVLSIFIVMLFFSLGALYGQKFYKYRFSILFYLIIVAFYCLFFEMNRNKNALALFLVFQALLLLLVFVLYSSKRVKKNLLFLSCSLFVLLMSTSLNVRSLLFLSLLFIIPLLIREKRLTLIAIFSSSIIIVSLFMIYYLLTDIPIIEQMKVYSEVVSERNLNSGRQIIWPEYAAVIKNNLLFGVGAEYRMDFAYIGQNWSAHNTLLQVTSQVGILGATIFCFIFLFTMKSTMKSVNKHPDLNNSTSIYLIAIFIGFLLIICFFEVTLFQNSHYMYIYQWLSLGVIYNYLINLRSNCA